MHIHATPSQSALESFKAELKARDDLIEKLRKDILCSEEKRDFNMEEVFKKYSKLINSLTKK